MSYVPHALSDALVDRLRRSSARATTHTQLAKAIPQPWLATVASASGESLLRYPQEVSFGSPVAYWRLGDANSTAVDASGNGRTGTYVAPVAYGTSGALAINLSSDADDAVTFAGGHLSVAHHASLSFAAAADFTIELWIRTSQSTSFPASVIDKATGGVFPYRLRLVSAGAIEAARSDGTNTPTLTSGALNDNAWHYVVFTKSASTLALQVDQGTEQTTTDTTSASTDTTATLTIGGAGLAASLDEIAVYPSALSAQVRTRHWNAAKGVAM